MSRRLIFVVFFLLVFLPLPAVAKAPVKVRIAPFAINGAGDYLGPGLASMLASRLGISGDIEVVGGRNEDAADYDLKGSVTAIGKSYSIDVRLVSLRESLVATGFFATAQGEEEILGAVDKLSGKIRGALSGEKPPVTPTAEAVKNTPAKMKAVNVHPERPFIAPPPSSPVAAGITAGAASGPVAPVSSVPTVAGGKIVGVKRFDKSGNIKFGASAMAMGDLDGDGESEVVFASPKQVRVYRLKRRDLAEVDVFELPVRSRMHFVDVADLDGDGRGEILVSCNDEWEPRSLVLALDGGKLILKAKGIPWFIRTLKLLDGQMALLGQTAGHDRPLGLEIHRLKFTGKGMEDAGRLQVPQGLNLFAMAFADVDGDGTSEIVAIDQSDKLSVYRSDGRLLWRSSENFAGVNRFLGGDKETVGFAETDDAPAPRIYLATRIEVADINGDGVDELVVNRNPGNFSRILARSRLYSGGEINVLAWNGIGMTSIWKSPAIEGYVIGNRLVKTGSRFNCVVGLVLKTGWLDKLMADESALLFFPL